MLFDETELKLELEEKLEKFKERLSHINTGKPSLVFFENIMVDAYGGKMKLNGVAQIIIEDATTIKLSIWDKGLTQAVENALRSENLTAGIQVDSGLIRVKFNPITEEDRKVKVKELSTMTEEGRIQIRAVRQEFMKKLDSLEGVSEDDQKRDKEKVQKVIDEYISKVEESSTAKEKDLMAI